MILIILFICLFLLPPTIALGRHIYFYYKEKKLVKYAKINYKKFEEECKRECNKKHPNASAYDEMSPTEIKETIADKYHIEHNWRRIESLDEYLDRVKASVANQESKSNWIYEDGFIQDISVRGVLGTFLMVASFIGTCVTGGIAIGENMSWNVQKTEISINERITELQNNKYVLEKNKEQYSTFEWNKLAMAHNEKAKNFYIEIQNGQVNRHNPWISWMTSPAYDKFNISEIKEKCTITLTTNTYTTYTGE